ncbi:MAG: winged helix-turn-helix domain-containing protein [Blastocatellia bacterium]
MLLRNGEAVPLTPKALKILLILVQNSKQVVGKDDLMREVWPDTFVEESNLTQHIFMLRRTLRSGENGAHYIETLPKRGYRFSANVVVTSRESYGQDLGAQVTPPLQDEGTQVAAAAAKEINSVVVLPVVNLSQDSNAEYLTDGLTESMTKLLSRVPRLRVLALGTIFRYKGPEVDPLKIGRELGVRAVLAGQVIKAADRLIIKIELIEVDNGLQVWCEQYDPLSTDTLKTQEEIVRRLSERLRLKMTD